MWREESGKKRLGREVIPHRPESSFLQVRLQKAEEEGAWECRAGPRTRHPAEAREWGDGCWKVGKLLYTTAACRNQVMDIYADLPHPDLWFTSHAWGLWVHGNPSPSLNR